MFWAINKAGLFIVKEICIHAIIVTDIILFFKGVTGVIVGAHHNQQNYCDYKYLFII